MRDDQPMKTRIASIGWLGLAILGLSGCGNDSRGGKTPDPSLQVITLDAGITYEAQPGARLVTTTAATTRVQIEHHAEKGLRRVTLVEGAADLYLPTD